MIVFASDNGYAMHSPKNIENGEKVWLDDKDLTNKGPFKGGKFGVFEGGMRIPFTIKMPNQKSQSVISEPVWLVDLFSTFSSLINHPIDKKTDGHDLIPLINGDKNAIPKNRFMYFYKQNEQAIRQGSWFAYRPHPTKKVELYLIEEDQTMSYNYEKLYPIKAKEFASIMNKEHQESEWYWNPGDNAKIFQEKVKKAKALGLEVKKIRPNNLKLMPWEK
jgi:arylsulfatase